MDSCSNDEDMLLTSIKESLFHGGEASSSLRYITQGEIQDYLSITRGILSFEGRRNIIYGIFLLLKLLI